MSLIQWMENKNAREPVACFLKACVEFLDVHTNREEKFFDWVDGSLNVSKDFEDRVQA